MATQTPRGRLIKGFLIIAESEETMKKIGRKRTTIQIIANVIIRFAKRVLESDMLAKLVVYSYVILGFMLVLKVLVLGA